MSPITVTLSSTVRPAIEDELRLVRRQAGDVEGGGYLFTAKRPGRENVTVCLATHGGSGMTHSKYRVTFEDPYVSRSWIPRRRSVPRRSCRGLVARRIRDGEEV
jgi:hypothetical protein